VSLFGTLAAQKNAQWPIANSEPFDLPDRSLTATSVSASKGLKVRPFVCRWMGSRSLRETIQRVKLRSPARQLRNFATGEQILWSEGVTLMALQLNREAVSPFSPTLPRSGYVGSTSKKRTQPHRGCVLRYQNPQGSRASRVNPGLRGATASRWFLKNRKLAKPDPQSFYTRAGLYQKEP
jgi:hypothetical protein